MRKFALSFLVMLLFCSSYAQLKPIDVPEVWETEVLDFPTPGWNLFSRVTYTFNSICLPTEALAEALNVTTGTIENASFLEISYNSDNLPSVSMGSNWNSTTNQFEEIIRTTYAYSGTVLQSETYAFKVGSAWEDSNRKRYTYDSNGLYDEIFEEDWDGSSWVPNKKETYTHNASDLFQEIVFSEYVSGGYVNNKRETYTSYVGDNLTEMIKDDWNGSAWEADEKEEYNYDASNFLVESLYYEWDGSEYDLDAREVRTNNAQGQPTERVVQNRMGSTWQDETRGTRSYPPCALAISEAIGVDFKMYPNPASEQVVVTLKEQTAATIQIVDSQGKMLYNAQFEGISQTVPVSKLSTGIYFITLTTDHGTTTKKMVKR